MRLPSLLPLLFAAAATVGSPALASDCTPAAAKSAKVPFRPRAWAPPPRWALAQAASGMTEGDPMPAAFRSPREQALAGINVEVRPDGSRHAVLGGAIRAWSVASVDEQGRLQLDCVGSEAAARARVTEAGARGGK